MRVVSVSLVEFFLLRFGRVESKGDCSFRSWG